jgi:hypothetical protein
VDILRISAQIASGLAAAHKQGVIHRDIKPANIMLEDSVERVKITDFGLARVMVEQSDLTAQGGVVGTPAYMSPEQVNGETLDPRSDLFSLGTVMYAMMAGYSPFRCENALGTARRVATMKHASLDTISKDVPPYFVRIVDRLLEKDPQARYQSARELVDELTEHLARANQGTVVQTPSPVVEKEGDEGRRQVPIWLTATVVAIALSGLSLALLRDRLKGNKQETKPVGVLQSPSSQGRLIRVARDGTADVVGLAAALRRAVPGSVIRVEDSGVYEEALILSGDPNHDGVRIEAAAGATLRAQGNRPVLTLEDAARVTLSGFRIEAGSSQHAIELRGACPGVVIEDCLISCSVDSPIAAVYLHAGASGTLTEPIVLRRMQVRCGGVGLVLGGLEDTHPVSHVRLTDSEIRGPGRAGGVLLVFQVGARDVAIRRNLFATGVAAFSLVLESPDSAEDVVLERNTLGDVHYAFTFGKTSPSQRIRVSDNLIVGADSVMVGEEGVDAFAPWFRGNWWERGPNLDEALASRIAELKEPLSLASRDPESPDYLKPASDSGQAGPAMPGRHAVPAGTE